MMLKRFRAAVIAAALLASAVSVYGAWTRATTRSTSDLITASIYNTDLVDNLQYLYDNSQGVDWTPTWSTAGTQPSLGNGTVAGKYGRVGKWVWFSMTFTAGSTTTFGTGRFEFLLPVTGAGVATSMSAVFVDNGTQIYTGSGILISTTEFTVTYTGDTTSGGVTSTTPFTWANGDSITVSGLYLAAAN